MQARYDIVPLMRKPTPITREMVTLPPEIAAALGRRGGAARWRGVSKKKRSAYGRRMARKRWARVRAENPLDS